MEGDYIFIVKKQKLIYALYIIIKNEEIMDTCLPTELIKPRNNSANESTIFQTAISEPAYIPDGLGGSPSQYLSVDKVGVIRAGDDFLEVAPLVFNKLETPMRKVVVGVAMATLSLLPR